jgi:tetratricopeptide (TPR) repeat protein
VKGVPNEYRGEIRGIREVLLRAIRTDYLLPESYYQLARYYQYWQEPGDERQTLERALEAFDLARIETPKRLSYHINALQRYAEVLINNKEFFPAEEELIKAANLYEDGVGRQVIKRTSDFGKVYASLGDLEYFVKDGNMAAALDYYRRAGVSGFKPPELRYRMGACSYQLRDWQGALDAFYDAAKSLPLNRRILYALGNVSYLRGDYYMAQGYYDRLLSMLEADKARLPVIAPTDDESQLELAERLMVAQNNMGVTLDALAERTGNNAFRSRADGLYADSERAWDVLTRNPTTMVRLQPGGNINAPGVNPAYLNIQNNLYPVPGYQPQFFMRIDKDVTDKSPWDNVVPSRYSLSEGVGAVVQR